MNTDPTFCVPRSRMASPRAVDVRSARTDVAVLADTPIFAHGFAELIRGIGMVNVVAATTELDEVLDLVGRGDATLVVISSARAGAHAALGQLAAVDTVHGGSVTTILIVPADDLSSSADLRFRASTVVTTDDGVDGLVRAVFHARSARRMPAHSRLRPSTVERHPGGGRPALTPRELEVLQGIVDGLASKYIAERLGVSVHTVRTHVQRLLPKLGAHTRLRATVVALEEGLAVQSCAIRPVGRRATTAAGARSAGMAG